MPQDMWINATISMCKTLHMIGVRMGKDTWLGWIHVFHTNWRIVLAMFSSNECLHPNLGKHEMFLTQLKSEWVQITDIKYPPWNLEEVTGANWILHCFILKFCVKWPLIKNEFFLKMLTESVLQEKE